MITYIKYKVRWPFIEESDEYYSTQALREIGDEVLEVGTVGFLVAEDENDILIAGTAAEDGYTDFFRIAKSTVLERIPLGALENADGTPSPNVVPFKRKS